jgi:hypothetical protein
MASLHSLTSYCRKEWATTSGAIHRYVPVSAVIISVTVSSRASPKSVSFSFLRFAVSNKLSAQKNFFQDCGRV